MDALPILFFSLLSGGITVAIGLYIARKQKQETQTQHSEPVSNAPEVGQFYDDTTSDFLKVYGEVIQAFRTHDLSNLLDYQIQAMELKPGMTAIDAGCGVCGPAMYFAEHAGVKIYAVTASKVQVEIAQKSILERGLENNITVQQGDYHQLDKIYPSESADVVYFLESFGHSSHKEAAISAAWKVLKPGGTLYIKDLFLKEPLQPADVAVMKREADRINQAYRYHIADLYAVIRNLRTTGWILASLKTIDLPLEDFENLSISNEFQELTGIGRIDSWKDYVFPIEFYEIKCHKPWHDPNIGNNRYFLQNLYYMRVHGKTAQDLGEMRMQDSYE